MREWRFIEFLGSEKGDRKVALIFSIPTPITYQNRYDRRRHRHRWRAQPSSWLLLARQNSRCHIQLNQIRPAKSLQNSSLKIPLPSAEKQKHGLLFRRG